MDTSIQPGPASSATGPAIRKLQRRTVEQKREVVEETLAAGASVARVARAHGINANQVFLWRRLYHAGELGGQPNHAIGLLPVTIADSAASEPTQPRSESSRHRSSGIIHLKLPQAQVRIDGSADAAWLRMVLECLLR
jgi:transposase